MNAINVTSGSLNNCNELGKKYIVQASANVSDRPITTNSLLIFVIGVDNSRIQFATNVTGGFAYYRTNNSADHTLWGSWYSFGLTKLT